MWYAGAVEALFEATATGRTMAKGRSLSQFQEAFPDEASCAAFLVGAALAGGFCLSRLWRATRGGAEEPGVHVRMPRLRPTDFGHGGNGDASFQAATDDVVLGGASHGDTFERHVGAAIGRSTRRHLQDRVAADAETAPVDGRPGSRSVGGRRRSRSGGNSLPGSDAFSSPAMPAKSSSPGPSR